MARRHASSQDFALVGMGQDPTPGDPDLIRGVLQRYQDIGDAAEKALNIIKKDGTIAQGRGSAMDQLKAKIGDDLPDKLTKTMNSYHDAARAYTDYIPRLQEAQDTFDKAVDQAESASAKAGQTPPALGDDPTDEERSAARSAQDRIDQGKSELSAAKSLAEQAKTLRETAQRACADVLDRAAGEAIPERNIFQKISDFFKDFPFVQILLGLLIAAVSVFFPVAGLLLGGALFAITQISAIASGNFSLGDFVTGLIGLVPGAGLLGKLGGDAAKGAVAAKELGGVAKVGGGSIKEGVAASAGSTKSIGPLVKTGGSRAVGDAGETAGKAGGLSGKIGNGLVDQVLGSNEIKPITVTRVAKGIITHAAKGAGEEAGKEAVGDVADGQPVSLDVGKIAGAAIGGAIVGAGGVVAAAGKFGTSKGARIGASAGIHGVGGATDEASAEAIDGEPLDPLKILEKGGKSAATGAARTAASVNVPRPGANPAAGTQPADTGAAAGHGAPAGHGTGTGSGHEPAGSGTGSGTGPGIPVKVSDPAAGQPGPAAPAAGPAGSSGPGGIPIKVSNPAAAPAGTSSAAGSDGPPVLPQIDSPGPLHIPGVNLPHTAPDPAPPRPPRGA
ncbi:hypothetical protein [Streptomyces sp. NBC_01190]|uniref:hypothetical protein n=1 Tax=Streptomyces sp. NBC_01190 TaxID=2903767 RepID=UPI003867387B|nr:hypothetical protein OG519_01815 [Streptomyces sp. NBC_01190]